MKPTAEQIDKIIYRRSHGQWLEKDQPANIYEELQEIVKGNRVDNKHDNCKQEG